MMALQKLFCVCLRVNVVFLPALLQLSSAKVFLLQYGLGAAFFMVKPREHTSSISHAHATPFLPLVMHFAQPFGTPQAMHILHKVLQIS